MALSTPIACLLGFVGWTLVLLTALAAARLAEIVSGKAGAGDFPAGVPHGGDAYWRLNRAHSNCLENLPIFAIVVLTAAILEIQSSTLDTAAVIFILARIAQSITHLASGSDIGVSARFSFYLIQILCIATFLFVILTHS